MQKKKPKFYLLIYALFIVGFIYFYYSDYHDHNILSPVIILLCLFPLVIRCIYWQVRPIKPSIRLTIIIVSYLGSLLFFFTNTGNIKSVFFVTLVYLVIPLLIGIIMFFITKKKEDILLILMSFIILLIIPVIYFSVENAIETIKYSG